MPSFSVCDAAMGFVVHGIDCRLECVVAVDVLQHVLVTLAE